MSYSIFCYRKNNKAKNCILNNYQIPTIVFTFNEAINVLSFNQVSFRFFWPGFFRISFWIASHDFQYKLKIAHNYRYFKQSKVGGGVQSFFHPLVYFTCQWLGSKNPFGSETERCFFPEQIQNETTNFQLCLKHIINLFQIG